MTLLHGDCLEVLRTLEDSSVDCCITSPPYWGLRDYGVSGQIGKEETPEEYVSKLVRVFQEVKRVLKKSGTLWLNLGDSYNAGRNGGHAGGGNQGTHEKYFQRSGANVSGLKSKNLIGIPWKVAFALQADGWYLRQDIIWHKPNPKPESVRDRCTKSHEYIFLLSKEPNYYFDHLAIKELAVYPKGPGNIRPNRKLPGERLGENSNITGGLHKIGPRETRNRRSVWTVPVKPFNGAHFATFPPKLIEPCVLAGCPVGGVILDPFAGAGTTAVVAKQNGRKSIGIELNSEYIEIAKARVNA